MTARIHDTHMEHVQASRLQRLASRGLAHGDTPKPVFIVRCVMLEQSSNPTDGALIVKSDMCDAFADTFPERTTQFYEFLDRGAEMFFLLQETAEYMHYWFAPAVPFTPYSKDIEKIIHRDKSDFAAYVYATYLDYHYISSDDVQIYDIGYPKRVAIGAIDLSSIQQEGLLVALYTGNDLPYILHITSERLHHSLLYVLYNSIKIGYGLPIVQSLFQPYGVSKFGGNTFDIGAAYWLIFGKKTIPTFEVISKHFQFAHWKNGLQIIQSISDNAIRLKALCLLLSNEVREYMLIRDSMVQFIMQKDAVSIFQRMDTMLESIYKNNA